MKSKVFPKLVCLFLIICMLATLMYGCQKQNAGSSLNSSSAEDLPMLTYDVFTFTQGVPAWVDAKDDEMAKYVEKRFKIKVGEVTYLQEMTFKERMNLFIASNELPDVVHVYGDTTTCPASGRYAELGALIKENMPNYMQQIPEKYWKEYEYNGKTYSVTAPSVIGEEYPDDPWVLPGVNFAQFWTSEKTLAACGYKFTPMAEINAQIKASGKKATADLYKIEPEIKTPEDLYQFFKKIKQVMPKVNGNDVIPFSIPIWLEPHFGFTFGLTGMWKLNPDTKKVANFLSDDFSKDYWKYMNKLYNEGLLDKDFAVQQLEQLNEKIVQGRVKCWMWGSTFPNNTDIQAAYKEADPNDCVRAIRLPKQPGSNQTDINNLKKVSDQLYFVNKDFEDIPRLLQYWDWCQSKEATELSQWGPEELGLWEIKDGKKVWKDSKLYDALLTGDAEYLKTNYWNHGLMSSITEALSSKTYNGRVAPILDPLAVGPNDWRHSYTYEIKLDDFTTQNNIVGAGGGAAQGYVSAGVDEATNKVVDYVYGDFENTFSPKLFAAKNDAEFEKNWTEIQKYWTENIGYVAAKQKMEQVFKDRGFEVITD